MIYCPILCREILYWEFTYIYSRMMSRRWIAPRVLAMPLGWAKLSVMLYLTRMECSHSSLYHVVILYAFLYVLHFIWLAYATFHLLSDVFLFVLFLVRSCKPIPYLFPDIKIHHVYPYPWPLNALKSMLELQINAISL